MDANPLTPRDLFHGQNHYQIPPFQRPYVWNEEDQWAPLWEDIARVAKTYLEQSYAGGAEPVAHHFLGAVVFESKAPVGGDVVRHDVIDGQQRMTTIQLLLDAVEEAMTARGHEDEAESLHLLIRNTLRRFAGRPERFKLWPSRTDRDAFAHAMDPVGSYKGEHRILGAHRFFGQRATEWLTGAPDDDGAVPPGTESERAAALGSVLMDRLYVVAINLKGHDDAQLIFETLNDRGTPLLKADLVKNWVFREGERLGADVAQWVEDYWSDLDSDWWREEVGQGRQARSRIDTFLQYWLTMKRQDEVQPDRIFPFFVDTARSQFVSTGEAESLLRGMKADADTFRRLDELTEDSSEGRFYRRVIDNLELAATTPVLLWLLASGHDVPESEKAIALKALESWVVRRTLLRMTTRDVRRFMVTVLKALSRDRAEHVGRDVIDLLSSQTAETRRWPSDREVMQELPRVKVYGNIRQNRLQLVLANIEVHQRAQDARFGSVTLPTTFSLEHVMPRAWRQHWDTSPPLAPEQASERDALVNTLGNLTLVTQSLNSSLSNRPWRDGDPDALQEGGRAGWGKRTLLQQFNLLVLNKEIIDREKDWDDDAIRARSAVLAEAVCAVWMGPAVDKQEAALAQKNQSPGLPQEPVHARDAQLREPWATDEVAQLAASAGDSSRKLLDYLAVRPGQWWSGPMLQEADAASNPHGTVGAITRTVTARLGHETPISSQEIDGRWCWSLEDDFAGKWRSARGL